MLSEKEINYFWNKVEIIENSCWKWKGSKLGGYGIITVGEKSISAHRASWIIHNGEFSRNLFVLHVCDNPECCNPNHLFLGNQSDNMQDMISKNRRKDKSGKNNPMFGRKRNGDKGGNIKVNWEIVRLIRKEYNEANNKWGMLPKLGKKYGLCKSAIEGIVKYYSWREDD